MTNTHGGVPIKTKSSLLCLAASPVLHRNDNSLRIFSCEDTKEKKKRTLNAFEYSFLSYLVLFCFFPLGECRKMCGALTKSLFSFWIIWHGEILHPVMIMMNWGSHCESPAGCTPERGLSARYGWCAALAPFPPGGTDTVFSHNGELSIKMTGAWKDTRQAALPRWCIMGC